MAGRPYIIPATEEASIRRRLAEAIAWCATRPSLSDLQNSLRTPELRPTVPLVIQKAQPDGRFDYECPSTAARAASVNQVADKRASLLAKDGTAIPDPSRDLTRGRMLVFEIDNSVWDGLSPGECGGFIDDFDIPAWDTWIDLRSVENEHRSGEQYDLLLCWIPPRLIDMTESAISVNCTSCLQWVDELVVAGE